MDANELFRQAAEFQRAGRWHDAEVIYRRMLQTDPANADAWHLLGMLGHQAGQRQAAIAMIRRALELAPAQASYWNDLAVVYQAEGDLQQAVFCLQRALQCQPDFPAAQHNLAALRKSSAAPSAEELNERGLTLLRAGNPGEAVALFEEAVRLRPDYVPALNNLGNLLKRVGLLNEAEQVLLRAAKQAPDDAAVHNNLGEVYRAQARFPEALASYRAALRHVPPTHPAYSNLLFTLSYDPAWDADAAFAEHRRWGKLVAAACPAAPPPYTNVPDPDRRLRIGYVSPYFCTHSVPMFFEPALRAHDPARFVIYLYGEVSRSDEVTTRLQSRAAGWRSTVGRTSAEVAEQIRADGIDLLIDLAGHTGGGRLDVFALRPAPVQATYLVYPNTTGLEAVTYRLTDEIVDPPGEDQRTTERLYRLPGGFLCFQPPEGCPDVAAPPVLTQGRITFGSPHLIAKLNDELLDIWARLLAAVPEAQLAFGRSLFAPSEEQRLRDRLQQRGIDPQRVTVTRLMAGNARHLQFAATIDLFLDSFPYSGHATACEHLWMGVPVVTLRGKRPAGRVAASILTTLGLPELIAETPDEYIALAVGLARDVDRLTQLRASLRERVRAKLCVGPALTRRLEDAYRSIWSEWCRSAVAV